VNGNELKYTSLTSEDILKQVYDRFLKTPDDQTNHKFDNFRESSIAQTLIEIFSGVVDINNYYIQRRAEECYFDTAQLKSSVISLSRMLGYVMNRREPSRANIRMIIKGDIEDNQIQIPYYSKFSYDGHPYILKNTMTYRMSDVMYNNMNYKSEITIDMDSFENPIEIIQGSIKEKVFNGTNNSQINAPFQIYKIEDKTFSNVYGDKDFFYNDITQIYVGETKTDETKFSIDRRSLLNWETIDTSNLSKSHKVCVVRTSTDGFIEILFGDGDHVNVNTSKTPDATGGFARKGAITRKDNIYVQYLSCEGKSTNKYGVIGDKVDFSGKIYNSNGKDITNNISFELISNVYGGADDESMESIKYSSPKIYYSLDRLVTKSDYIAYMKSLNSPINVQNAIAWGEQEERDLANKFALAKMFNVVLFSMIGSLYDLDTQPHAPKIGKQYDEVVLDLNYNPYEFQTQGYFNIFAIQQMVNQLNRYKTQSSFYEIDGYNLYDGGNSIEFIASNIQDQLKDKYPNKKPKLYFDYSSDSHDMVSNLEITDFVVIDLNSLYNNDGSYNSSGKQFLDDLALLIDKALIEYKDIRGNKTDNVNFNKQAFIGRGCVDCNDNPCAYPDTLVSWENTDAYTCISSTSTDSITNAIYEFRLRFNDSIETNGKPQSPCYITKFPGKLDSFAGILGLNGSTVYETTINRQNNEMNGKISQVVNDLSSRSQTNVKNIYVSPIIHQMDLVGEVYVKSLYDKEQVKKEIINSLYEWLDINADFNQPLYLSNIIEIFENHSAVVNANIRLKPTIPAGYKGQVYNPSPLNNKIYYKYTVKTRPNIHSKYHYNNLADTINKKLIEYLTPISDTANIKEVDDIYIKEYDTDVDDKGNVIDVNIKGGRPLYREYTKILESIDYTLLNHITERSFYNDFVAPLYEEFKSIALQQKCGSDIVCVDKDGNKIPNAGRFIGFYENDSTNTYRSDAVRESIIRSDFAIIMEQIHKDLSRVIRVNLIDSYGNINKSYNKDNEFMRGGYSLGSEIVQILTNSKDPDDDTQSLLQFKYK